MNIYIANILYFLNMDQIFTELQKISLPLLLILSWTLPWKAVALWKAAKNNNKVWFVLLFILNTLAILDIIYIFVFGRKKEDKDIIKTTLNI